MQLTHTLDSQKLAEFAAKYEGEWHTFKKDKRTIKAVDRARILGEVEVNEFNQFRYRSE